MSQSKAGLAQDGQQRVWITVQFAPALGQLAEYLWDGLTVKERFDDWSPEMELPVARVKACVDTSIHLRGSEFFIEDDDQYEHEGGREWAQSLVRRVYKFPEEINEESDDDE